MYFHRGLFRYLSLALSLGIGALVLSYVVWTSAPWYWAYGVKLDANNAFRNLGGGLEGVRLVLLCGMFYLIMTSLFPVELRYAWGRSTIPKRLLRPTGSRISRLGWVLWIGGPVAVVVFHLVLAPLALKNRFESAFAAGPAVERAGDLTAYWLPYLLYLPYAIAVYMMLAVPLLLLMVIAIRHDRGKLRDLLARVEEEPDVPIEEAVIGVRTRIRYVYANLRQVMNRYGWVLLLLAVYYILEYFTPMADTLSCWAQVISSWSAWLFALVIVPYFFFRTYGRYNRGNRSIRRVLTSLRRRARSDETEALRLLDETEEMVRADSLVGYLSLFRKASVVVMLAALVTLGVVGAVAQKYLEDPRDAVNRALPVPLDYGALYLFDLFADAGSSEERHEYRACVESEVTDKDEDRLRAHVASKFPPSSG